MNASIFTKTGSLDRIITFLHRLLEKLYTRSTHQQRLCVVVWLLLNYSDAHFPLSSIVYTYMERIKGSYRAGNIKLVTSFLKGKIFTRLSTVISLRIGRIFPPCTFDTNSSSAPTTLFAFNHHLNYFQQCTRPDRNCDNWRMTNLHCQMGLNLAPGQFH